MNSPDDLRKLEEQSYAAMASFRSESLQNDNLHPWVAYRYGFTSGAQWQEQQMRTRVDGLIKSAMALRMYCLGSDTSTRNMITRFDKVIAAFTGKEEVE